MHVCVCMYLLTVVFVFGSDCGQDPAEHARIWQAEVTRTTDVFSLQMQVRCQQKGSAEGDTRLQSTRLKSTGGTRCPEAVQAL